MLFRILRISTLLSMVAMLQACVAMMKPMELTDTFWAQPGQKVVVVVDSLPKPGAYKTGNQGLLDVAINQAVSNSFDSYISGLAFEPYEELADQYVERFQRSGFVATMVKVDSTKIPELKKTELQKKDPNVYPKDLSKVEEFKGQDYALIVHPSLVGTTRAYYGFIPMSAPQAVFNGSARLVDLRSNQVKWWKDLNIVKSAAGDWDQPPSYPNVTQAIDAAIEESKRQLTDGLFQSAPSGVPMPRTSAQL